jgi:hypothetical protein
MIWFVNLQAVTLIVDPVKRIVFLRAFALLVLQKGLGLARIDFERCAVTGEVIYSVEGDSIPTSQQDEESRIATLAHALKKLCDLEDAAEFMRCLNAICQEGDARYRQVAASYYYGEIAERGLGVVLKEMISSLLCLKVGEPAQGSQSGHETIFTAPRDDKPRDALNAFANRPPWNCKAAALVVRPGDGILIAASPKEDAIIYPLRLDELELPAEVSADEREHQPPIGAVILQDSFREQRSVCGSAPDHSV